MFRNCKSSVGNDSLDARFRSIYAWVLAVVSVLVLEIVCVYHCDSNLHPIKCQDRALEGNI